MKDSARKAMYAKSKSPHKLSYGYTIGNYESYDKDNFMTKEKALKSAISTVRNLQKGGYADELSLANIRLFSNAKDNSSQHKQLMEFQKEELG